MGFWVDHSSDYWYFYSDRVGPESEHFRHERIISRSLLANAIWPKPKFFDFIASLSLSLSLSFRESPNPPPSSSSLESLTWCFRSSGTQRSPALVHFSELVFSLPPPDSTLGTLDSVHASSLSKFRSRSSICDPWQLYKWLGLLTFFGVLICVLYSDWCSRALSFGELQLYIWIERMPICYFLELIELFYFVNQYREMISFSFLIHIWLWTLWFSFSNGVYHSDDKISSSHGARYVFLSYHSSC